MKLKIRVDQDDLLMFIIFAIFLLYLVAVTITNVSCFAQNGYLYGPNPLPAFSSKYITATLVFYIGALAAIILSVKSKIFEFDKGFGITTEKKDKGYSRWTKDKEIMKAKKVEAVDIGAKTSLYAGTPLLYKNNQVYVDNGENHTLVIGATGSGKTQDIILPTVHILSKHRESMVITDPKGEIYEKTSEMLRKKGYQILLLNFRDPQNGSAWNPLDLPYKMYKEGNTDKAIELLDDLALNILYDESNKNQDPFWEKSSASYFSGIALGLFKDAKPDEININSINLVSSDGDDRFGGSTYIKEYFNMMDHTDPAYVDASGTVNAPAETKGSILAVFKDKIKTFASRENLSEMLSHSDVDLSSIGKKPTAVFIVIQDEKKTYHALATILLKQIYETLIAVAQENGGALPVRTNFLLDEFANMPPLKDVTTMITAARSRKIRFTMIIQNFAQLDSVYGDKDAETIRGNCGNLIYLVTTELKALEEISKMAGEVKSKKDEKTASKPLVTISDLQHMKEHDVIIMRLRMNPFKTHFKPDYELDWGDKCPKATYPTREKMPVHTFDIKEFVKKEKKKKLLEMMNDMDDGEESTFTKPVPSGMHSSNSGTSRPKMNSVPDMPQMPPFGGGFSFDNSISNGDSSSGQIDVDDLVKKIDAKIAELEKEEREEKKKEEEEKKAEENKVVEADIINKDNKEKSAEPISNKDDESINKNKEENLDLDDDDDDDDDFFDDFFDN